ncbi:MAG TPA: hypothetical protein VNU19_08715, partial [Candidatus Acidoferrum sp.]|nr:hypothetical protein [Candidatus Acidoferrum sp.]
MSGRDTGSLDVTLHAVPGSLAEKVRRRYADNGLLWGACHFLGRGFTKAGHTFDAKARAIERSQGRPGTNTVDNNRVVWGTYDWSSGGEEWSASPEWRESVIEQFIRPHLADESTVLEIGPGAGRWTGELHERAAELY